MTSKEKAINEYFKYFREGYEVETCIDKMLNVGFKEKAKEIINYLEENKLYVHKKIIDDLKKEYGV